METVVLHTLIASSGRVLHSYWLYLVKHGGNLAILRTFLWSLQAIMTSYTLNPGWYKGKRFQSSLFPLENQHLCSTLLTPIHPLQAPLATANT